MTLRTALTLLAVTVGTAQAADNPVADALLNEGWPVGGKVIRFAGPTLSESDTPEQEQAALKAIAGSDRALADLTRDSVSAPFVLKTADERVGTEAIVRKASLWFVIRARLDQIDPAALAADVQGKEFEAGNMRTTARRLTDAEVADRKLPTDPGTWYVHSTGRLLDRIEVSATARIAASRSPGGWLIASRSEPLLDDDQTLPNRWRPIQRKDGREQPGMPQRFAGGASLVRISELETVPGALLVEAQFAFEEPLAWFDGAPILRSKLGLIAQDRIRALRRELAGRTSR